ncbi:MAG: ferric reductase-like transmembrane domain-containing protein [Limnoraphis sp. WC205]|jgi:predicted ferric reductase/Ca2+-binding EF-hand superfamily protein|nr:ferric reductase-like transmembrane domain-containing protein [Limnoraphis sp. WC205]
MDSQKVFSRLKELQEVFTKIAGEDGNIDQSEFQKGLGLRDEYISNRLFTLFDTDKSGTVCVREFIRSVENLVFGTTEEKLKFSYLLHDHNGDGGISKGELHQLIMSSLKENNLDLQPEQVVELVDVLFLEADINDDGEISFEEFKVLMAKSPALMETMAVSPVTWLTPHKPDDNLLSPEQLKQIQRTRFKHYLQNNWVALAFLGLYIGINLFLFFEAFIRYGNNGANFYVQIARGCGATLNFNGALILIPVMRHFITWLRKGPLNNYLPLDEHIEFHKLIGQVMFASAIVHTIAHFFNYTTLPVPFLQSLFGTKAGFSGLLLLIVFGLMWVTAQEPIRKGGKFALFYMAHMAYVLWFILALIHGPVFWKWASVPIIGYAVEQVLRWVKTKEPTHILNASLLPSKVLGLTIERPPSMNYQPGDYLFLKCPSLSNFEWHPFTISSAPEQPDVLSVHIRAVGSWTGRLYQLFKERREEWIRAGSSKPEVGLQVYIDGPYGTPSTHIFESKYVMLVAAGIGVTPFASILRSILERQKQGSKNMRLKKVYFYWLNRDQKSFEWFIEILSRLEQEDTENLFDLNLYLTGAQKKSDMKSSTLFMAMDMMHSRSQVDLITGLKSPTHTGRPDWDEIFRSVSQTHKPEKVDVFFCGSPGLSQQLNKLCHEYGFGYRKENF